MLTEMEVDVVQGPHDLSGRTLIQGCTGFLLMWSLFDLIKSELLVGKKHSETFLGSITYKTCLRRPYEWQAGSNWEAVYVRLSYQAYEGW